MLKKLDERTVKALVALDGNHDWQTVVGWLTDSETQIQSNARMESDNVRLRWMQGALQIIGDIAAKARDARSILTRFEK